MTRRIALIGAGAIARVFYLPALHRLRDQIDDLWIVDPGRNAVEAALKAVNAKSAAQLGDIDAELDLVIIAAPNALHAPIATQALERNSHILIEKPFVVLPSEGEALVALAAAKSRLVAVNQTRRYYPALQALRDIVDGGTLGALKSIEHLEGVKLDWPFESGAAFSPGAFRTGAIMDFGVHVLDYYHALLRPEWSLDTAIHDGFVGPEGLAEIRAHASGVSLHLRLSRYQFLRNMARLTFERGAVEFDVFDCNGVSVTQEGRSRRVTGPDPVADYLAIADRLILDVLGACETGTAPHCTAADSLPVIRFLDTIYSGAKHYPQAVGAV
ncbi:MAG TPA: Gfo/Idh/MocA family oxidoreductase [Devosia sp.]|nr:Gfo/Idh/MocA family oxidoreductase [Devosia sp.]